MYQIPMISLQNQNLQNGFLSFKATDSGESVVALRTVSGNYTASTFIKSVSNETVGLSAYSWRGWATGINFDGQKVSVFRRENNKQEIAASADVSASDIYLQMTAKDGEFYQFAYSLDGKNWINLGKPIAAGYIEGARVALTHSGTGKSAKFDWLKIVQN
ncbi:MAG: hypothetical protein HC846_12160 [Blastocatellia bacterium]|nr:hypothetical protein [Blastocatellia bacterium]